MTSSGDDAGIVSNQPKLVLPHIEIDPETNSQKTPQTPPTHVDSALLELIHSVQHELRTPLHGMLALITSLSSDLKEQVKETENEQRLSDINTLGTQLLNVLDDFRDYATQTIEAKIAEDNHEISPVEEANLGEVLDELASDVWNHQVHCLQTEKGADVRIPPPPELILTLDTSLRSKKSLVSVDAFRKVARKLIDNAMRFTTGEGFVEISLAPHREQDLQNENGSQITRSFLRLSVEDTGTGMTNDFVSDDLFTPFAKADKFKSGAGLSMALCSSIVRRLGGSMQVSSDKGRGTTIIVLFPVKSDSTQQEAPSISASTPDELVYFFRFHNVGLQRLAGSIASQLATFGNLYTTTKVNEADYILLPEEVCYGDHNNDLEKLLEEAKQGVKIGVLQAHQDAKIGLITKKIGFPPPVFVTRKPFGPQNFSRLIQLANKESYVSLDSDHGSGRLSEEESLGSRQLYQSKTGEKKKSDKEDNHTVDLVFSTDTSDEILRGTPPAARLLKPLSKSPLESKSKEPRTFSALCVEDNPLNMRILTRVLSQCNIPFCMAVDGQEAVEQFEKQQPALVLLDINMPKMNGYDACKEIRRIEKKSAHIVAITALSDDFSKKKGIEECGMDEWLSKPLDILKFKERIKGLYQSFQEDESF